jgi:trimethylamine--corrinoid protein Co-methyltransferase
VQLVLDNEVFGMVRRTVMGINFDNETMAWEDLMNIEPGGHFLTTDHTLRHCRDGLLPINFTRVPRDSEEQKGSAGLVERATEYYKQVMKQPGPMPLPDDVIKHMDEIVKAALDTLSQ